MIRLFVIGGWSLLLCFGSGVAVKAQDTIPASLNLIFAGDIMGHADQIKSAEIIPDSVYDYTACFVEISPLIKEADLAMGNLELTLPGKPPYTGYPDFKSPDALAEALAGAGFDLLFTANNHSADAGSAGIVNTIATLEKQFLFQTGTFRDSLERELLYPLIIYRKGFKLAFLNYTYGTNGVRVRPPHYVNRIDEDLIADDIARAKAMQADFIIIMMHWGEEYQTQFNRKQEKLAEQMIAAGADLIVGSHPHVVQPMRWYEREVDGRQKKVLVAYSLGNFISGQTYPYTDGGILLKVVLEKNTDTYIKDSDYVPVWRNKAWVAGREKPLFRILPISGFLPDGKIDKAGVQAMRNYYNHIADLMKGRKVDKESVGQPSNQN